MGKEVRQKKAPIKYGHWGTVKKVNSFRNAVNVRLAGGIILEDVPVATWNWVCDYNKYLAGERNLPPENSRVFVLMPTGTFDSAFVLCSGLSFYEDRHKSKFMANNETEKEKKNSVLEKVTQSNWKEKKDLKTGQINIVSPKENIKINIQDDSKKQEVKIDVKNIDTVLNVNGAKFEVKKDGNITIKAKSQGTIYLNGEKECVVNGKELKQQLEKVSGRIDKIINALKNAPVAAQDGGATYKASIVALLGIDIPKPTPDPDNPPNVSDLAPPMGREDFNGILNNKVKHGG